MNSHRLIASLKAQDKASFRLSLAHWKAPGLRSPPISAFASKADIAKRPGHFRFASNSGFKQFKRLVNFLNLRKKLARLIHDDTGRGLVQGALSVARLSEVSRFGSFVEPMADWFQ